MASKFHYLATHGYPEGYDEFRQPFPPSTFHQALMDGEHFVHIADTSVIGWEPGNEAFRRAVETSGAGTVLLVPLRSLGPRFTNGEAEARPLKSRRPRPDEGRARPNRSNRNAKAIKLGDGGATG
jgi:hypothetical protein